LRARPQAQLHQYWAVDSSGQQPFITGLAWARRKTPILRLLPNASSAGPRLIRRRASCRFTVDRNPICPQDDLEGTIPNQHTPGHQVWGQHSVETCWQIEHCVNQKCKKLAKQQSCVGLWNWIAHHDWDGVLEWKASEVNIQVKTASCD
jgi:hypothetical protein